MAAALAASGSARGAHGIAAETHVLKVSRSASAASTRGAPAEVISTARTLEPSDSGKLFLVKPAAADYIITLPTAADMVGCTFDFMIASAGATAVGAVRIVTKDKAYFKTILQLAGNAPAASSNTQINFINASSSQHVVGTNIHVHVPSAAAISVVGIGSAVGLITNTAAS